MGPASSTRCEPNVRESMVDRNPETRIVCRFVLYLGDEIGVGSLVTEPSNSIIHQSFQSHEREEPLNGDGFGVAWYVPEVSPEPALFKDVTPAWNNTNLRNLARVTRSRCILAHVRAATLGLPVIQLNCHPFSWGPYAFMHNGTVGGFHEIKRALLAKLSDDAFDVVRGTTDSEHVFALFVDRVRALPEHLDRSEKMRLALVGAIADVESIARAAGVTEPSKLNLAVTDGEEAVVTRYISRDLEHANSLHVHTGGRYVCEGGRCHMVQSPKDEAIIVASEPLSEDPGWRRVPPNHLVRVGRDLTVAIEPMDPVA